MKDDLRIRLIPTDRIRVANPRSRDRKKFERIVESIRVIGLKKPITVARVIASDGADMFDLVCGTDAVRRQLLAGVPVADIWKRWNAESADFRLRRRPCLLYR